MRSIVPVSTQLRLSFSDQDRKRAEEWHPLSAHPVKPTQASQVNVPALGCYKLEEVKKGDSTLVPTNPFSRINLLGFNFFIPKMNKSVGLDFYTCIDVSFYYLCNGRTEALALSL